LIETKTVDGIAILTLDHGPVNAMDLELLSALPAAFGEVAEARAVVLTGAGRSFCAGVDLKRIVAGGPDYVQSFLPALSLALLAPFEHPKPVVAALNGHALAGGCILAAACDHRLMSGGTIGVTELAAGVPFPTVALEILRHVVGPEIDRLVLTADRLTPDEGAAAGLVDEVVEPADLRDKALERAAALSAAPADVYALSKRQLHGPALDRIHAVRDLHDPAVLELWSSERTHTSLREYLASLA
jgi:enoyl-CoA hydratase/carnithine racemase